MSLLVLPSATRRSTCNSRGESVSRGAWLLAVRRSPLWMRANRLSDTCELRYDPPRATVRRASIRSAEEARLSTKARAPERMALTTEFSSSCMERMTSAQQSAPGRVVEDEAEAEHLANLSARGGHLFNRSRRLAAFENRRIGAELDSDVLRIARRIVDIQYPAGFVFDERQRRAVAHEGMEAHFTGLQLLFGQAFLLAQNVLHQRVLDRGPQAAQAILEEVVGAALPHHGDGRVFADGPGHDDERDVQPALLQQLQRPSGFQFRHAVIGEDHVGRRVEVRQKVRFGLHPLPLRIVAAAAQLVRHQLGVLGPGFQYQCAKQDLLLHVSAPHWWRPRPPAPPRRIARNPLVSPRSYGLPVRTPA